MTPGLANAETAPEVADILADVGRLGMTLQASEGKVRFRPRSVMPEHEAPTNA